MVAAVGRHGDGIQASWSEDVEGALSGLPGEDPLSHDDGVVHLSEDHSEAVPFTDRSFPQNVQTGFLSVTDDQLLHWTRGCRGREKQITKTTNNKQYFLFCFLMLSSILFFSEPPAGHRKLTL